MVRLYLNVSNNSSSMKINVKISSNDENEVTIDTKTVVI